MRPDSLSLIGRRPLLLAMGALLLAVLPLFGKLTPWVLALYGGSAVVRVVLEFRGARLPGALPRLAIAAGGVAGILLQYGSLMGLEAGLAVLMVLSSVKILEARGPRDFHVLIVLGWFLCLTQLFFAQDLLNCLYAVVVFLLLTVALVQAQRRREKAMLPSVRVAGTILLQSLPLVLILFFLFPRSQGGFRFQFSPSLFGRTGMSDRLYPGSVASIATSDEIAFRAYFREGEVPSFPSMYWRGGVLWTGNGMNWAPEPRPLVGRSSERLAGPGIWQRIVIEPHGERWLFALDWPVRGFRGATMEPGNYLRSDEPIFGTLRYEVTSRTANREERLHRYTRRQALELPAGDAISPAVRGLAATWRAGNAPDAKVAEEALQFFRKNGFRYTLSPGTYSGNALDEFLFVRREGFCEHYAAAFATLMRVAGVPSRVVVGYQGGEFNPHGNYVIVRQSDAHAWCEIWLPESGWRRVDPTAAIAPQRTASGLNSFLESAANLAAGGSAADRSEGVIGIRELLRDLRLVWDAVNYQWDLRVLNFDQDSQRTFLASVGLGKLEVPGLFAWILGGTAVVLAGLAVGMRRRVRARRDPVAESYAKLCARLSRAGVVREENEGPVSLRDRAVARFPDRAESLNALFERFIELRYGKPGDARPEREFARAVRDFR